MALAGNPNAGKTTLFNALTGLRAKTANFPGTTIEHRTGRVTLAGQVVEFLDLPGMYSLSAATSEEQVAVDALKGRAPGLDRPTAVLLILDATNLERNLFLASQVLELGLPTLVALNMVDLARKARIKVDPQALARELHCPVVPVVARGGQGLDELRVALERLLDKPVPAAAPPSQTHCGACGHCPLEARYTWAEKIGASCSSGVSATHGRRTEAIDRVLTHPLVGVAAFAAVMFLVFAMIFWIAQYPMEAIDWFFGQAQAVASSVVPTVASWLPEGGLRNFVEADLRSLLAEGVIGGVGGMLVFLPQICILFFFLSLLEDTGYLARAAFVMDRLMGRVGLPGKAFVPMISAHACAIPAIMATRVIEDRRDRLATILILPLFSCSARIPVYAMVVALLFPGQPWRSAAAFTGAYLLGILAALTVAFLLKKSVLRGESRPLVLELPSYKMPSLRNALVSMLDRALVFVRRAGTVILLLSVLLWALATYPKSQPPPQAQQLQAQAAALQAQAREWRAQETPAEQADEADQQARELLAQSDQVAAQHSLANSFAGRIGHFIEPALAPLGFDWQIGIGVISSFAAREVIVSTLAVVYGVGADSADEEPDKLYDTLRAAQRSDGSAVFTAATCVSLLVFYVLAMQCLPTNVVARRETGSWKWPVLQFAYMTVLAYVAALVAYRVVLAMGIA